MVGSADLDVDPREHCCNRLRPPRMGSRTTADRVVVIQPALLSSRCERRLWGVTLFGLGRDLRGRHGRRRDGRPARAPPGNPLAQRRQLTGSENGLDARPTPPPSSFENSRYRPKPAARGGRAGSTWCRRCSCNARPRRCGSRSTSVRTCWANDIALRQFPWALGLRVGVRGTPRLAPQSRWRA
jgi:hypothetical protein